MGYEGQPNTDDSTVSLLPDVTFLEGDTEHFVGVEIFYDELREMGEALTVYLKPNDRLPAAGTGLPAPCRKWTDFNTFFMDTKSITRNPICFQAITASGDVGLELLSPVVRQRGWSVLVRGSPSVGPSSGRSSLGSGNLEGPSPTGQVPAAPAQGCLELRHIGAAVHGQCHLRDPITFGFDIRFQQVNDPVAAEFSPNTQMLLFSTKETWSMGFEKGLR
ncbi:hypothetical protein CB1_000961006 [Camelus ferus]|nr:hypothetical protein CB1_000961006 [Camelus ferus]